MKLKVLPGLVRGHARLAWYSECSFSCHLYVGAWGGMWVEAAGVGVALFWATATQGRQPPPSAGGGWKGIWPSVPVWQGHPACTTHSGGWHSTGALLCLCPALTLLSCTLGVDEEMADVLQDVGLRNVSTGLMVLRRCWGNSAVPNPCLCCSSCSSA